MKTLYTDMDIHFSMDHIQIYALNIVFERFTQALPSHSHGNDCYEIHYIPYGCGKLVADGQYYDISPNTLLSPARTWNTPRPLSCQIPCRNTVST